MGASEKHAATYHGSETHGCEICGETYPSMRAAWMCEERDLQENREARRPVRSVMRPASYWEDD